MSKITYENLSYLKLLLNIEGIGPQKIFSLLSQFREFEPILKADFNDLLHVEGISKILATKIHTSKNNLLRIKEELEHELDSLKKIGGKLITYWDENYPDILRKIYFPPLIIYTLGNFSEYDKYSVSIVGTRLPSPYGKLQAEKFSTGLANKNITVVSGLARGIDSFAHEAALKAGGRTIAVIGTGLDIVYPPENKKLFEQIKEKGLVISEFGLGTKPDAQNFPRRNRIISGLSLGTLVIETKLNGGAMQTAAYALDQNREVFAIPGNININQSEGPNKLIQNGEAKLVTSIEDILLELQLQLKPEIGKNIPMPSVELNLFEEKLINVINTEPKQIDEIATISSMSTADCLVNLLTLEFKGLVKQLPGKMFVRC
ncbi:MAG: DNA-processing protein DprA [Ignavibacteriales bacterium]|nr:DNA-processing protein DprA [Ignavibacteriales bacterium]